MFVMLGKRETCGQDRSLGQRPARTKMETGENKRKTDFL